MLNCEGINVGDTVHIPIPSLNRARGDPRIVIAVLLEVTEDGLYRIGNPRDVLDRLCARNQMGVSKETRGYGLPRTGDRVI